MMQATRAEIPTSLKLPDGFVYLSDGIPAINVDLRYSGARNFLGKRVEGYRGTRAILAVQAVDALAGVQAELSQSGQGLKIFDAYRPQRAVDQFVRWANDGRDSASKAEYYPDLDKSQLIPGGYIAEKSSHSRGSTLDLTVVRLAEGDGGELDMGTPFDFFGPESWPASVEITSSQRANRTLLHSLMARHGFRPLKEEWWHFTLSDEPFPDTYFDFPVE